MYRKLLFLLLCGRTLTAPQGVETIADVKPTIFDYPAEVYDLPAPYPAGDSLINGNPYSAIYDMTTENIELETTDYNEELSSYDKMTESIPRYYESGENSAEIYSKLGYFMHNYLPGQRKFAVTSERNQIKNEDMNFNKINNKTDVNISLAKDKINKIEETTINSENKPITFGTSDNSNNKVKDLSETKKVPDKNQGIENTINIKNIANVVEDKPNYETSKPSYFSNGRKGYFNELVQKGRRKFRSNCRCEKIWNCPKLQITVPRCPDEYFMCCF